MKYDILKNNEVQAKVDLSIDIAKVIANHTIQFFINNDKGEATPYGSGVLIELDNKFFMVTASHVIAENPKDLFTILPNKELTLGGTLLTAPLPESGKREDDKIDIAIMELAESVVHDLSQSFKFIQSSNIDINHTVVDELNYLLLGYPETKTKKIWNKPEILAKIFHFISLPDLTFDFAKFGFEHFTHIAIQFHGKAVSWKTGKKSTSPILNGISGSGVWYFKNFPAEKSIETYQLVGIVIEQIYKSNHKAVIATKIGFVTEIIRQKYNMQIPMSNEINITISEE
jgi:hypothetical protein